MIGSETDAELGEVAFSLPIKLVPARKIGIGNGTAHRYKNNFEFEFNQRNSRENIDINLGIDGADANSNQFFISNPSGPSVAWKGDSWGSYQSSIESSNSNGSSRVPKISSYDSCFGIQSLSSEETDISTPFHSLPYQSTESAFRLIDSAAGIATSGSLSTFTQSKRDFTLTPGPPKKPNSNENSYQSNNHPHPNDPSVSTESFNYLFSTPAKASEAFYMSPEVEAFAEACRTTVNTTSLSPDMMNIVSQLLKVNEK